VTLLRRALAIAQGITLIPAALRGTAAARHPKAPAQASPPAPGTTPPAAEPGQQHPPPGRWSPLRDGIYGRCTMAVFFYDTGITVTYDHIRKRRLVDIPPADEWGGLEGWLRAPHDFDGPAL
jgi:hypothetical protein